MEETRGFKVEDKRCIFREDKSEGKREEAQVTSKKVLPPVNFSTFIASLSSSTLVHLGEIPDPLTGKRQKDLDLAKQTIEILEMLQEKTRGNLDKEEEALLNHILFDLRVKYVKLSEK